MREIVKTLKALSDETRIRIINLLLERECCVCEVMQALKISQTRASRNLSILNNVGLLRLRKDGLWSVYSVNGQGMTEYKKALVELMRIALRDDKVAKSDRANLRKTERLRPA